MDSRSLYFAFGVSLAIAVMQYREGQQNRRCIEVVEACCMGRSSARDHGSKNNLDGHGKDGKR